MDWSPQQVKPRALSHGFPPFEVDTFVEETPEEQDAEASNDMLELLLAWPNQISSCISRFSAADVVIEEDSPVVDPNPWPVVMFESPPTGVWVADDDSEPDGGPSRSSPIQACQSCPTCLQTLSSGGGVETEPAWSKEIHAALLQVHPTFLPKLLVHCGKNPPTQRRIKNWAKFVPRFGHD